jgi:hypothetical protein
MKPRPRENRFDPGQATNYWRKKNRPPTDDNWIWLTREMLSSYAFRQLSGNALDLIFRVAVEHLANGGRENGELLVTYDDFESYGIPRKAIYASIQEAEALGWIIRTVRGRGGHAGDFRW